MDSLRARLDKATKELKASPLQVISLDSTLQDEHRRYSKLEAKHNVELTQHYEKGEKEGLLNFKKSQQFAEDVALLSNPTLQVGVARALDKVAALNLPGFALFNFPEYDPKAEEKLDRLFYGYSLGYSLVELVANPNLELPEKEASPEGDRPEGEDQPGGGKEQGRAGGTEEGEVSSRAADKQPIS